METKNKILIIDDEPEFKADLQAAIEQNNYKVITAASKAQAQEIIRREKPDLIVLGTIAPRGDAFLFHQWLKRNPNLSCLPLIVIDASPEKQLIKGWAKDEGLRLESEDYFCKPLNPTAIIPFIDKLLDRTTRKIKVLVVDDHSVTREGIRTLLSLQKDIEVIGEAIDGKEAVIKTIKLTPDVVLMDIVMPVMDGLEATREICQKCQNTKVLILTQYNDDDSALASYQAGAFGFIPKSTASSHLITGIRTASKGIKINTVSNN
jgi:DNA-binding NarL/FixJ family response regulator